LPSAGRRGPLGQTAAVGGYPCVESASVTKESERARSLLPNFTHPPSLKFCFNLGDSSPPLIIDLTRGYSFLVGLSHVESFPHLSHCLSQLVRLISWLMGGFTAYLAFGGTFVWSISAARS
jgi:hypothetical protein